MKLLIVLFHFLLRPINFMKGWFKVTFFPALPASTHLQTFPPTSSHAKKFNILIISSRNLGTNLSLAWWYACCQRNPNKLKLLARIFQTWWCNWWVTKNNKDLKSSSSCSGSPSEKPRSEQIFPFAVYVISTNIVARC